jgi:CBS domain-containing protein
MTKCPFCDFDNIQGIDLCAKCEQPLTDEYLRDPETAVERGLLSDRLGALKPHRPVVVSRDMTTRDVLRLMVERKIGSVLVMNGDQLIGIFSERDALMKLNAEAAQLSDRPVAEFMTTKVESLDSRSKIAFAVHRMDLGSYRHVPVVDQNGQPTGVISVRDILRYITERASEAESV